MKRAFGPGLLSAALILYANVRGWRYTQQLTSFAANSGPLPSIEQIDRGHVTVLLTCLGWAARDRLTLADLGMGFHSWGRSALWGLLLGGLGSASVRGILALPPVCRRIQSFPEWRELEYPRFVRLLFGPMLVNSALFEEIAFRGLLHTKLGDIFGSRQRIVVGGAIFAAWHLVIAWFNLSRVGVPGRLVPAAYCGVLLGLTAMGSSLAALRQATGHIVGGVLVHWFLLVAFAVAGRRANPEEPAGAKSRPEAPHRRSASRSEGS